MTFMRILCVSTAIAALSGCMSTGNSYQEMTPEQQQQANEMRQRFLAAMMNAANPAAATVAPQEAPAASFQLESMSASALSAKRDEVAATGHAALFSIERDGISINGNMYLDPEGSVEQAGWDVSSGQFTYITPNFDGSKVLKFSRAGSKSAPLTFAQIQERQGMVKVTTVDGVVMGGEKVIPTSNGVIVTRGASMFRYTIGAGMASISIPKHWSIAAAQNGDVDSTGLVLLERNKQEKEKQDAGLGGFLSALKETGKGFGLSEVYDYALLDVTTGHAYLLNISLNDKEVSKLYNCERQNDFVNKCRNAVTYESLYQPDGRRNRKHYFWALTWFNTAEGPIALYNSGAVLTALWLSKETEYYVFERTLGINEFDAAQAIDGTISLDIQLGLSREQVPDLLNYISASTTMRSAPLKLL